LITTNVVLIASDVRESAAVNLETSGIRERHGEQVVTRAGWLGSNVQLEGVKFPG